MRVGSLSVTSGSSETVITPSELPAAATTYLTTNFPGFVIAKAEKETTSAGVIRYEVKFTVNGISREAYFDATGVLIKIEVENGDKDDDNESNEVIITSSQLPTAALTYLNTNYAGYVIVKAKKETSTAGVVRYEVKFTLNGMKREVNFDANGLRI